MRGIPRQNAYLISADTDSLTIIVDGSTVEVFADGGVIAMAPACISRESAAGSMSLRKAGRRYSDILKSPVRTSNPQSGRGV